MVEEKETKVEKKEIKKLDDVKDSPENKAAISEAEGRVEPSALEEQVPLEAAPLDGKKLGKVVEKVEKSKDKKKEKKGEVKVELEREYVVPLRRGFLNVPRYRRAKKAVKVLREFMVRHMNVRDGDLGKVKIDGYLNNEIWFRGIKKPMSKVKVRVKKIDGIVYVELAEDPEFVKFAKAREAKRIASVAKGKKPKKIKEEEVVDKDKDGVEDKVEEKEDVKSGAEKAAKVSKSEAKGIKHTAQGKHMKKSMPVRKALKK